MVQRVLGVQKVEYDKKDGSGHVSGVNLFLGTEIPSDRGSGYSVSREYISTQKAFDVLSHGCDLYEVEYGKSYTGNAFINAIYWVGDKK